MNAKGLIASEAKPSHAMAEAQAAKYTGLSIGYLRKSRCKGYGVKGPHYRKIGRRVIYLRADLDAFLDQSEVAA
jgi:hypothetical protein